MDNTESKAQRAVKRQRNLVAKHSRAYNHASTHRDRTKHSRDKYPRRYLLQFADTGDDDHLAV
jgi:hypothetical protein